MDPSRCFVKDVKRVIIQVGTTVATRSDGRLAVGRIGCLSEQIKDLNSQGYEVILVNSGAVDIGHQRLRYRRLVNSSFTDLQKPQLEFDGKACAAVGQNGLIGLYDALFTQLDMASSHIFVADKDFDDPSFRMQLSETLNSLLSLKAIPIFNENDAIRTRRAPYEDTSDIFWDNDRLASLLAMALKADLLILLSDVEGLYSDPPSEPDSKIIHTYVKEVHQSKITFGDKSRIGKDGMTAKVEAAVSAVSAGIPVVISSGFAADDILKVLKGEKIGTLFHRDAEKLAAMEESSAREMAISARQCSRHFQNLMSEERKKIMLDVANALEENEGLIIAENQADVVAAKLAGYDQALVSGLTLIPGKQAWRNLFPFLTTWKNRLEETRNEQSKFASRHHFQISDGLLLKKTSSPQGVFLFVVESSPKDLVLIASLALRSGRGLLLKGGKEAAKTNAVLHKVITDAIPETVGKKLIGLVPSREEIPDLLKLDDVIDLVIPRGSNEFIFKIKENTKIRLLGHSGGISHVYIDKYANMETAKTAVLNARTEYPAACNAIETLLVHKDLVDNGEFNDLITALKLEGVNFYGGPRAWAEMGIPEAKTFHHEYNSLDCSVEIVDDVTAAINLIRNHGRLNFY